MVPGGDCREDGVSGRRLMGRVVWPLALVAAFGAGLATATAMRPASPAAHQQTVERLQQQIAILQARLRGEEKSSKSGAAPGVRRGVADGGGGSLDRFATALAEDPVTTRA